MNISEPYVKVICISFYGLVDDNSPDYKEPEEDTYLLDIKERFEKFLKDNHKEVHMYNILESNIAHPGSSGYENGLFYLIGFNTVYVEPDKSPTYYYDKFMELIKHFKV